MRMESEITQKLLSLGALSTAIFAIFRLQSVVKASGAKEQRTEDRLSSLETGVKTNRETVKKIFEKIDQLAEDNHKMMLCVTRMDGKMDVRISKLEVQGCDPVHKDEKAN